MATLSLRVDAETESRVDSITRRTGLSKSEAVRAAIKEYALKLEEHSGPSLHDKIKDQVGRWDSGGMHLSTTTGDEIARMMLEERQRRAARRRGSTGRAG